MREKLSADPDFPLEPTPGQHARWSKVLHGNGDQHDQQITAQLLGRALAQLSWAAEALATLQREADDLRADCDVAKNEAEYLRRIAKVSQREADGLRGALRPLADLPTDFARNEDQVVFTVLGGPYALTPEAQSWAGNRSIYVRDIRRARAALSPAQQEQKGSEQETQQDGFQKGQA
ncbi:MAG TPA: hypothetical protein VM915_17325 [Verrucomicrobiae bacterium]|nr:hypothetical protein [Verrucomicrobiae bacterium]